MRRRSATLRTAADIVSASLAPENARDAIAKVADRYAAAITPTIARLIAGAGDPIARQFVPDARELIVMPAERADPIGDDAHSPVAGVVHRYEDRALLKIIGVCPVYCRFCFRREMIGPDFGATLSARDLAQAIAYFAATPAIREVILTGGDPMVLSPRRVSEATAALARIPHIEILRWHTRVPVVDPERITPPLISALHSSNKRVVVAIHCNHARELSPAARAAIVRLAEAGVPLLSQTVLLKDVNDSANALEALMRAFVDLDVQPYYLHHGDLAPGTSHFRSTIREGRALMRELARRLPPLARPRYMLDIPGGFGKIDLMSADVRNTGEGEWRVIDRFGSAHVYRDAIAQ